LDIQADVPFYSNLPFTGDVRVRLETGQESRPISLNMALATAEMCPFVSILGWNGHAWEVVWDGAVEFDGVAPDPL